ncbi:1,6-dihydroxycyclohexa-2,4-diene-1-carboxylate dehydrogenase [Enteractinococcus fodinae]|uniref:Dihydroxycyclohexadiene carboxylate dehydrogenase n=1 Tax=Enteractinococcus fodinae TaxID=684663 RepID=A0ABU2B3W6_9MICC|nr:benzoate diol dehydrogenase BenD [Enteractinococcus fodinae]MDR7347941.1 dihydroxycyclohexadiene carboxylate dehydrogenase [Enteractinococcus fodinae]
MAQKDRFTDKVVIVTGAAQGIGELLARSLVEEGAKVVVADKSPLVNDLAQEISDGDGQALAVVQDLELFEGAQAVAEAAIAEYGRIDILFNNVGGTIWTRPYEHYEPQHIEDEINRSLFPTLWCSRAVLPQMLEQEAGVIVNVSSIATRSINRVPYAAAKGGVNAMTKSLAFELGDRGVRVLSVAVGGTEAPPRRVPRNPEGNPSDLSEQDQKWYQEIVDQTTDTTTLGRYGTLEEMVAPLLFAASDEASYMTGSVIPVGGGDQG